MAPLPDRRRERFCQEIVKGRNQTTAYELAGFSSSKPHASRLARDPRIIARIDELRHLVREKFGATGRATGQGNQGNPDGQPGQPEDQPVTTAQITEIVTEQEVVVSLESLLRDLQQAQDMAYALKKPSVIVQVVQAKAVLAGLTFKPEARPRPSRDPMRDVSDERLREILDAFEAIEEIEMEGSPEPK
jgi:phage terminase small subunit